MVYNFDPKNYAVFDQENRVIIKSVHNGIGLEGRRIFRYISESAEFYFYAKIEGGSSLESRFNADHWSLDGIARSADVPPVPIELPKSVTDEAFANITVALGAFKLSWSGAISVDGVSVRSVQFDL